MTTTPELVFEYTDSHVPVDPGSSLMSRLFYDFLTERLLIIFVDGNTAGYLDVPITRFKEAASSPSLGGYYNKYIRGLYKTFQVDAKVAPITRNRYNPPNEQIQQKEHFFTLRYTDSEELCERFYSLENVVEFCKDPNITVVSVTMDE